MSLKPPVGSNDPVGAPSAGITGIVSPIAMNGALTMSGTASQGANNRLRTVRWIIPRSGVLRDFWVWNGPTSAGNLIPAVYDTNDADPGDRSLLWAGSSVAQGTVSSWQNLGDPALTVTRGQQLDAGVIASDTTGTFGGMMGSATAMLALPLVFCVAPGGASPKLATVQTLGGFAAPATIAEATLVGTGVVAMIIARIADA